MLFSARLTVLSVAIVVLTKAWAAPAPDKRATVPTWAPADVATIHPGVNTRTEGGSCTANFVFYNGAGDVFIGMAAHCAMSGTASEVDGCLTPSLAEGTTPVQVSGASRNATLAFSSWARMQRAGGHAALDENTCYYNDFALAKLHPDDHARVNPSVPTFGGPTGIRASAMRTLEPLYAFGNSVTRKGNELLKHKYGVQREQIADGWVHNTLFTFGIPGDSGCAAVDGNGQAVGTLSTYYLFPIPTENGFTDVQHSFDFLRRQADFQDIELALGTTPFNRLALPRVQ